MNFTAYRMVVIASVVSLAAAGYTNDLRAEWKGEKQGSRIYRAPSRTPVVSRVPVAKENSRFTQLTSIEIPGTTFITASDINDRGQIVGAYQDQEGDHGFLLDHRNGNFTAIDIPGSRNIDIRGINNSGQMIGVYWDTSDRVHSFRLEGDTVTPVEVPGSYDTQVHGINDRGQVVGWYASGPAEPWRGFLLEEDGSYTTIDAPGAWSTLVLDINNRGQIVGTFVTFRWEYPGFILEAGVFTVLDFADGYSDTTQALGTNSRGQVVGSAGNQGFLYYKGQQTMVVIPSASETQLTGINDRGQIVGRYEHEDATTYHAFLLE